VSPRGFGREKNVARRADFGFAPIFTGEVFFVSKVLRQ